MHAANLESPREAQSFEQAAHDAAHAASASMIFWVRSSTGQNHGSQVVGRVGLEPTTEGF